MAIEFMVDVNGKATQMAFWITEVEVRGSGFLRLTWDDGTKRDVDVTNWLVGRPLLEMLQVPEVFRDVSIVEGGGGLEWVNGVDFCADALRMRADSQFETMGADA